MSTIITLIEPVTVDGVEIKEITLNRLKGRDLKEMALKKPADQDAFILSRSSKLPPEVFDELDAEDYVHCKETVFGFLGKHPGK